MHDHVASHTHPFDLLDFDVDQSHLSGDELAVLHHVHPQQVVVDQPQRDVTSELGGDLGQLRDLGGRGHVQIVAGVVHRAEVLVLLGGTAEACSVCIRSLLVCNCYL